MNNYSNDEVGIDPTTVKTIETLDVSDISSENKKIVAPKTKKTNENFKKILFVILIIILMGIVAFLVYYFLRLGNKYSADNISVTLNDVIIEKGEKLPTSLLEYGTFNNINIVNCSLNTNDVKTDIVGTYTYQVICDKKVYSANIVVKEKELSITGNVIYKVVGSNYSINDFVSNSDSYELSFVNEDSLKNYLLSTGGPYVIKINAKDSRGNTSVINSILYVTSENVAKVLSCSNDKKSYLFAFNSNNITVGIRYEINEFTYSNDEYNNLKNKITTDLYTIDNINGYVIYNDSENKISLVNFSTGSISAYDTIYTSYTNAGYLCK